MKKFTEALPYLALAQALLATMGSLFFSELLHIPPCVLCWYQRIFMYPLIAILTVGILRRHHRELPFYVLPLSLCGLVIAVYHNLLYYHILPESLAPCTNGVSCTTGQFAFDSVTIPFLSMLSFAFITGCMILYARLIRLPSWQTTNKRKEAAQ